MRFAALSNSYDIVNLLLKYNQSEIKTGEFKNCTKLINVSIPDSIQFIGKYAFKGCILLTKCHAIYLLKLD